MSPPVGNLHIGTGLVMENRALNPLRGPFWAGQAQIGPDESTGKMNELFRISVGLDAVLRGGMGPETVMERV